MLSADIKKIERKYIPSSFVITDWASLQPFFDELAQRNIADKEALEKWIEDVNELSAVVSEDACWRQIKMTCDTTDKQREQDFHFFITQIQPQLQVYTDLLNKKLMNNPAVAQLDKNEYAIYLRNVQNNIDLFHEANVPLLAELGVLEQQFGVIAGAMTVVIEGKEYTLQQAARFLESSNRALREEAYRKMNERRGQDRQALDDLYTQLVQKRQQIAYNAGFGNYRDYKFKELARFDYTPKECFQFHEAVKQQVLPLVNEIYAYKKQMLQLETLRPWDLEAEAPGWLPLQPFKDGEELLQKTIDCFEKINPFFAQCLLKMKELQHFDLESRIGKAPGGYNCPLAESGAPFIFMNAARQMGDVTTMIHEGGHAVHSFLAHSLRLNAFKEYPMEIAEVASMSMELFAMDYWEDFFDSEKDMLRAKIHQLERVITIFPWIAMIDKFQHWVYEHPTHSIEERTSYWMQIATEFTSTEIDMTGLEQYRAIAWQRQLHLFEVPFYYIEYGIAQLGAIGLWKQFKENKASALNNYINALKLGGTKPLTELYEAAGLKFDFSADYIKELMDFVHAELHLLLNKMKKYS